MSSLKINLKNYIDNTKIEPVSDSFYRIREDYLSYSNNNYTIIHSNAHERNNSFKFKLKENYFFCLSRGIKDFLLTDGYRTLYNKIQYSPFPSNKAEIIINNGSFYELLYATNNHFDSFFLNGSNDYSFYYTLLTGSSLNNTSSKIIHCNLKDSNESWFSRSPFCDPSDTFYVLPNCVFQIDTEKGEIKFLILVILDYVTKNIKIIIRDEYKYFLKNVLLYKQLYKMITDLKRFSFVSDTCINFETSKDFSEYIEITDFNIGFPINALKYKEILSTNEDRIVQSILSDPDYAETVRTINSIGDTAVPNESSNIQEQEASLLQ